MTFTVPVPLWFVVIMVVLCVAWQFAMAMQTRYMRDLYRIYYNERHGCDDGGVDYEMQTDEERARVERIATWDAKWRAPHASDPEQPT
jgi:hypothetical protein